MKLCSLILCFMYLGHCLNMKHLESSSLDHGEGFKTHSIEARVEKLKSPTFYTMNTKPVIIHGQIVLNQNFTSMEHVQLKLFLENPSDMIEVKLFDMKEQNEDYDLEHDNVTEDHVTSEVLKSDKLNSLLSVKETCQDIEWDPQGCVTCFASAACRDGWSYHSYENCGLFNWGCRSKCFHNYDWPCGSCGQLCPTPAPTFPPLPPMEPPIRLNLRPVFIINEKNGLVLTYDGTLKLQFIDSAMDIRNGRLPDQHHQLFIVESNAIWFGNTNVLSGFRYDKLSRTFGNVQVGHEHEKLCIDNHSLSNGSLTSTCSNCSGTTINWRLKSHEEAFPHDYNKLEEYYIAHKDSGLIVEKRGDITSMEGFPLYMWIPQDLPGQLWHSDSYGRILSRNNFYVEAADVLTYCFDFPADARAGHNLEIAVCLRPNTDARHCPTLQLRHFQFIVTHQLLQFRGRQVCQVQQHIARAPGSHITTTVTPQEGGHQQWVLHNGKLENGYDRHLLSLRRIDHVLVESLDEETIQMGMPTELRVESEDKFYIVPRELTSTWIDMIATKRASQRLGGIVRNAIIKELLFYQKTAAFHMSTVIGLSPEELITRAYVMKHAANEAASELERTGRNYAISEIVRGSVNIVATGFEILGYALAVPSMGLSLVFAGLGRLLSLSNEAVTRINGFYGTHTADRVEAQEVLGEIQRSVLTGGFALSSFLDDYVEVIQRYHNFEQSPEGQRAIQTMEQDADILAQEMGYTDFEALFDYLLVHGTDIWSRSNYMRYTAIPLIEYAMYRDFTATVFYERFTGIDLSSSTSFSNLFTAGTWIFSVGKGTFDIVRNAIRLGRGEENTPLCNAIRENVEFLDQAIPRMYSQISELAGDTEDLMFLEAAVEQLGEGIDVANANGWRALEDRGQGIMENEVYGRLYNVFWNQ